MLKKRLYVLTLTLMLALPMTFSYSSTALAAGAHDHWSKTTIKTSYTTMSNCGCRKVTSKRVCTYCNKVLETNVEYIRVAGASSACRGH